MSSSAPQSSSSSSPIPIKIDTPEAAEKFLDGIDYIMSDIDGVMWTTGSSIDNIPQTLQYLENERHLKLRFLTNNSTASREAVAGKFAAHNIDGVTIENIYTSSFAAALYLKSLADKNEGNEDQKFTENVLAIGEAGLHQELREIALSKEAGATTYGYELVPRSDDEYLRCLNPAELLRALEEPLLPAAAKDPLPPRPDPTLLPSLADGRVSLKQMRIGAIVVGHDAYYNSMKMSVAGFVSQMALRAHNKKVPYIVSNEDPQNRAADGWFIPEAGTVVPSVSAMLNRQPDVVCGKPYTNMAQIMFANEGVKDPSRCIMVGDRLTTDIAFGRAAGCRTLFVLSGCETLEDLAKAPAEQRPDFIADSLASVLLAKKK